MTRPILLDASTILAYIYDEPGGEMVQPVITEAYVTAVNMAEVIAVINRQGSDGLGVAGDLVEAGVTVVPISWPHLTHIGSAQVAQQDSASKRPLSLGDLCCLSYALVQEMDVWTADRDWAQLGLDLGLTVVR